MDGHENEQPRRDRAGDTPGARGRRFAPLRRAAAVSRRTGRHPGVRRIAVAVAVLAVTLAGVLAGVVAGGQVGTDIGPFRAKLSVSPATNGGTTIDIPPLGALQLDSHDGPTHLTVELGALEQSRVEALIEDPASLNRATQSAVDEVREGVLRLGLRTIGSAVLAALVLALLVFRDTRRAAWAGGLALLITAGSLGTAAATLRPQAIEEPRYEGLLVNAPAIVGDVRRIANDYTRYAEQLQRLIGNVTQLYTTVSALPVFEQQPGTTRVLHISDMHLNPAAWQLIRTVVEQFAIDVVIDTGDITDWGSEPEASYVGSISLLRKPYVYIRGNHDSGRTAAAVAQQPNAIVLDNATTTVAGLTIAGIGDPRFTPDKSTSPAAGGLNPPTAERADHQRRAAGGHGPQLTAAGEHRPGARSGRRRSALRHLPARAGRAHPPTAGGEAARGAGSAAHHADGGGLDRRRGPARAGGRAAHPVEHDRALLRPAATAPGVRRHHRRRHRPGPGQPRTHRGDPTHRRPPRPRNPHPHPLTPPPTPAHPYPHPTRRPPRSCTLCPRTSA